ncbi:hypothetical protein [uncultured Elizabethkingia sp.]|uniref:hypothetical protein n=1 Tax=uncultured Elizabethkingia sp. TaxID=432638 RepID=UPI002598B18C|nr:hypothetical protein [uncultured Elizabethkingia sp.]
MNPANQMIQKIIKLLPILIGSSILLAQNYQGKISNIKENGLHQIVLSPDVIAATRNNMDFIRIFDSKHNEAPYILGNGDLKKSDFKQFPISSRNTIPNVVTSVIISNENTVNLDNLTLKIANTEIDKKYNISGSNDQKEWFGLVDNQIISGLNESGKTSVEKNFSFPLNNYKFLKFDFLDKNSLPINVLEAGLEYDNIVADAKTALQNFGQKITTDKNSKQSIITITFPNEQVINGISFDILSPSFYQRDARVLINKSRVYKRKTENYREEFTAFQIRSKNNNQFGFPDLFTKELIIEIDNQDNPPLDIKKINLFQSQKKILADLKAGETYTLDINPKLSAPQYDLVNSGINLSQNYPDATITDLKETDHSVHPESGKAFWQTPFFVWGCIIIAIIIIGFFALGLIKDMNKKPE